MEKDLKVERQMYQLHKDGYDKVVKAIESIPAPEVEIPEQEQVDLSPIIESNIKEGELTRKTIEDSMNLNSVIESNTTNTDKVVESLNEVKVAVEGIKIPEVKIPEFKFPTISFESIIKPITNIFNLVKEGFGKVLTRGTKEDPLYVVQVDEKGNVLTSKEAQNIIRTGGFVKSVSLTNILGAEVNPATEDTLHNLPTALNDESIWLLRKIIKFTESGGIVDSMGRQRVNVENQVLILPSSYYASANQFAIPSTTGVPMNNANVTYVQPVQTGPYDPREEAIRQSRMAYAQGTRNNLSFS